MKNYNIKTYRIDESEKVASVLSNHNVEDLKRNPATMWKETFAFKCEKEEWKKIKKELNLEVICVFSQIRV